MIDKARSDAAMSSYTVKSGTAQGAIQIAKSAEEIEKFRGFYERTQWHPEADIDFFLTVIKANEGAATPYVMVLEADGGPTAMMVGRIDHTVFQWKIGYKTLAESPVRLLMILYGGILGDLSEEHSVALYRELNRTLARGDADMVLLNHVRVDSPIYRIATSEPGFLFRDHFTHPNPHLKLALPSTFEEFIRQRSENTRSYIRRYGNRLKKKYGDSCRVACFQTTEEVNSAMNDIESIAALSYHRGLGAGFHHTPETHDKWLLAAGRQWLRVYVLYLDEAPRAFWSGYAYKRNFYIEYTAFDPRFRDDRPGMFLLLRMFEEFCAKGEVDAVDFGFGDADYKRKFATEDWEEAAVYMFPPTLRGVWLNLLRTFTMGISRVSKQLLDRLGVEGWLKTKWRRYLARQGDE
jgi:hypothetical protein